MASQHGAIISYQALSASSPVSSSARVVRASGVSGSGAGVELAVVRVLRKVWSATARSTPAVMAERRAGLPSQRRIQRATMRATSSGGSHCSTTW